MRGERLKRLFGMLRLYGKDDAAEDALDLRRDGRDYLRERVDGALDREALGAAGLDVLGDLVDEQHVDAGVLPVGADGAADRAAAPDQDGVHIHGSSSDEQHHGCLGHPV